jgi:hypothetical protein
MKPLSLILVAFAGSGAAAAAQGPPASNCRRLDLPRRLPAMADLVDSAALASRLVGAPSAGSSEVELGLAFPRPSGSPQAWVLDARLQPGSGKPELDRLALLPVFARRWRPATLDGRPVEVWFARDRAELARP